MVDILGTDIGVSMPSWDFFGGSAAMTITMVFVIILILGVGGVAIWLLMQWRIYNRKIVVYENIAGQGFQPVFKDKAKIVKLGDGGEEILFLKKKKVYRTAYGKKMGKNTYWFAIGQDGYWYNCVLGDVDAKMGMLDIEPIDRDMRYMHVAIRKNIQDRYQKQNVWEKYGTFIMSGLFLVVMMIGIWFLLDKIADISTGIAGAVDSAKKVTEASQNIVSSLDNICGGSGIKPA